MLKKLSVILLALVLVFSSLPIGMASSGNSNSCSTKINVLYLYGGTANSSFGDIIGNVDAYFDDSVDLQVYPKKLSNFALSDFTKKTYSAIYIADSVQTDIDNNDVDNSVMAKLLAYDYPTVVENGAADTFGLANDVVTVHMGSASSRISDTAQVLSVTGHREFSEEIISDDAFSKLSSKTIVLYSNNNLKNDIEYPAADGLLANAIIGVKTSPVSSDGGKQYPLTFGYEPGQAQLDNSYRVASTFGTSFTSNYPSLKLSSDAKRAVLNAVWWVLHGSTTTNTTFSVQTFDDVTQTVISTQTYTIASNSTFDLSYLDQEGYRFLRWERVNYGSTTTLSDNVNYSVMPESAAVYRAVVEKVYELEIQNYNQTSGEIVDVDWVSVRAGASYTLSYTDRDNYEFVRWEKVGEDYSWWYWVHAWWYGFNDVTAISSNKSVTITPNQDATYRAVMNYVVYAPNTISILEVESKNQQWIFEDDIEKELKKLGYNNQVEITFMPMSVFNANREQLNGLYDVLYFGEYSSNQFVPNLDNSLKYTNYLYGESYKSFASNSLIGEYYAGNDMTQLKADEVKAFADTGQLLVFDATVFGSHSYATSLIKQNFQNVTGSNVKWTDYYANKSIAKWIAEYNASMNYFKPELDITSEPTPFYDGTGSTHYMTDAEDRYMTFTFDLNYYVPNHDYEASLYLDFNGDGLYRESDGERVVTSDVYAENMNDVTLKYNLPKTYIGYVPWKIEVEDKDSGVKTYQTGSVAFKGTSNDAPGFKEIKVLQIKPNSGNNYDLKNLSASLKSITGLYELNIDSMTADQYNANPFELNGTYDMVVLGFADSLSVSLVLNDAAIAKLQAFVDSGQSLLTTHDQLWFKYSDVNQSWMKMTKQFRDQFGQNIYANDYLNGNAVSDNETMLPYARINGKTYYAAGLTDKALNRYSNGLSTTDKALQVNTGQVTMFPYPLNSTLNVSTTHFQYYKLDLENEDLIVWYNLYGGNYTGLDSVNDYYVYSLGNITYSGTGHASPSAYIDENKLFVNTMIKASKTANHAPTIVVDGISDGAVYYKSQSTINFGVTVSDIDVLDKKADLYVYIDTNQDGVGDLLVKTLNNVDMGSYQAISIDKSSFNSDELFDIIVIASDDSDAKTVYTVKNVANIDKPALILGDDSDWALKKALIGDSDSLEINLERTGSSSAVYSDVSVAVRVPKAEMDALVTDLTVNGWEGPTLVNGYYVYTTNVNNIDDTVSFTPFFDKGEGELNAYVDVNYTVNGTASTQTFGPKHLEMLQGQFVISAKDRFNKSVEGALLEIQGPTEAYEATTVKNQNVIVSTDSGTGNYDITYYLDGYKDAELVITYADGSTETFSRDLRNNYVTASVSLDGDNTPISVELVLYQDVINNASVSGNIALVVSKEEVDGVTVFNNMGDVTETVGITFALENPTVKMSLVLDDSDFKAEILSGTGTYSFLDANGKPIIRVLDNNGDAIAVSNLSYNATTGAITFESPSGIMLASGIYTLELNVSLSKNLQIKTENQPHAINLVSMTTDVYEDVNDNGIYESTERFNDIVKTLNKSIVVGYLVFTDNTDDVDDRNGIVGFKTKSTNILEGAGYGDVVLYIRPSKDVDFSDVNIQLLLRYMSEGTLSELTNNENFYIVSIEDVSGFDENTVSLESIDGTSDNNEILISQLPKATSSDDAYTITTRIFIENSKFDFQDYRLVFSLIYGVNVQEAEINQYIKVIKKFKLE